jgi:hypothetical protein
MDRDQVPVADEHGLEERPCQSVPLPVVGRVPGGTGVEEVGLEPLQHLRSPVGVCLGDAGELDPERGLPSLVFALRQVSEHEKIAETTELPLECLALPIPFGRLGPGLVVCDKDAPLRVVRELECPQVGADHFVDDPGHDGGSTTAAVLPSPPASEPLWPLQVQRLTARGAAHQTGERADRRTPFHLEGVRLARAPGPLALDPLEKLGRRERLVRAQEPATAPALADRQLPYVEAVGQDGASRLAREAGASCMGDGR